MLLRLHLNPRLDRSPLSAAISWPNHSVEEQPVAHMQNGREVIERLELTRLDIEEDLLVVLHVEDAVFGEDAKYNAVVGDYSRLEVAVARHRLAVEQEAVRSTVRAAVYQ